ncbi:precorrin-8X methylmutase [Clostridium saccharobutylicum]|uniref:Cobalt-precorrin-8X methylmutase CbiC n=1 Tax=Clostridium saccharobutylicum DSM 13864 TaxID=1345695 RepID=U5MX59_CLOSA|nr:precorrin-8X methylmutase [Clostridium saccharobutylicum]AGX44216.1 cobalt-precorrin-8X methylmutase CbiC [Clostridium saccharobutylicum DSM 13864]AQR91503.1 cobalt-precorrin-8X methylmutase [Clostridium saccharobutylicum]AQS01408.1 cobalt-precorrin-8X methylmutase [Clostridium saccharobutylicum]AQS11017.1 cobalt-precorrin-8X methylmutase [Clostridium saccharobutylicum]AQS15391.1 cobalt-precorrin-8X methylmutase [Clostridium saccharobutylicum]
MDYLKNPMGIEARSFEIIGEEMGPHSFSEEELLIIKRTIHTTADFEYKDLVEISKDAIETGKNLLRNGAKIYTDTNMALNGINKMSLAKTNSSVICYVNEPEVHKEAKEKGITRSMAAVEKACTDNVDIFVFGNAPTALFRLKELIKEGKATPKLIIAVPVGFVGAAESKENMDELNIPYIRVKGRKGGSTVAASIINALMYMVVER